MLFIHRINFMLYMNFCDIICICFAILSAVPCVIYSLLMCVSDVVIIWWKHTKVWVLLCCYSLHVALYVLLMCIVSFCFLHVVEVSALSICIVLRASYFLYACCM